MQSHSILGNGFVAQKHREAIKEVGGNYIGAYDIVPERREISLEKALQADFVHICTPNVLHHQILPKKRLIIEKPVAISSSLVPDVDACVCYQRRFDKQAIQMKKLCEIEKPKEIIVNILVPRDPHYWESWRGERSMSGGGALMNVGIHYLDLLIWWLGNDYKILEAKEGIFQRTIDESFYAQMMFGKTKVHFDLNARHNRRKVEFVGLWEGKTFIYNTETATHADLLKGYLKGVYVTPREAKKSLTLVEKLYDYSHNTHP